MGCPRAPLATDNSSWESGNGTACHVNGLPSTVREPVCPNATLERKIPMTARLNGKQGITKRFWKQGSELEKKYKKITAVWGCRSHPTATAISAYGRQSILTVGAHREPHAARAPAVQVAMQDPHFGCAPMGAVSPVGGLVECRQSQST